MFVEGVRLFVVVLGTAVGFWAARGVGVQADGLGGILGCLLGYVAGGFFGRLLDRALGVVERRVEDRSPAQFIAGTLGAIAGRRARPRAGAPDRAARLGSRRGSDRRARRVDHRLARLPGAVTPERRGARSPRDVDAAARARAGVQRARRVARRHVRADGRPAPRARARGCRRRRPDGRAFRARRDPGIRRLGR